MDFIRVLFFYGTRIALRVPIVIKKQNKNGINYFYILSLSSKKYSLIPNSNSSLLAKQFEF